MKVVAFHLPQFHPVPENDQWWGAGFSEWTNVARARPLFRGHRQPLIPGELGFYDLRLAESLREQTELAKWGGVSAFCFYHYWFDGRKILETPIELFLRERTIDFPFCICWANHSWTGHWAGEDKKILVEQTYPGVRDDRDHYLYLRRFFEDERYLRIHNRPVFVIFRPEHVPHIEELVQNLKRWSEEDGLGGLYVIGLVNQNDMDTSCFDAVASHSLNDALASYLSVKRNRALQAIGHRLLGRPRWVVPYADLIPHFKNRFCDGHQQIPTVLPNWDNTPRVGKRGMVLTRSSPELFYEHLVDSTRSIQVGPMRRDAVMFVKSWNEWAEGNFLEPEFSEGRAYLTSLRRFTSDFQAHKVTNVHEAELEAHLSTSAAA